MKLQKIITHSLLLLSIIIGGGHAVAEDFNPANPPEPQVLPKLKVVASPTGVAQTSGTGRYKIGTRVYINTSAIDTDYAFKRWEKNGETISTSRSFYYDTTDSDETLTAVWEFVVFDPSNPPEPSEVYKYTLLLVSQPEEACSFNLDNGSRHLPGESFDITAYANQGFRFDGWFDADGKKVSDALTIPCTMPRGNAMYSAHFTFLPDSPDEPQGNTPNVDNQPNYDVNGDGIINSFDTTSVIKLFLDSDIYIKKYDVNGDGVVNVLDVTLIISKFLSN